MLPTRTLGTAEISRLIIGGNPISGHAHSGYFVYGGGLFRSYYTEGRVLEALRLASEHGINTWLSRADEHIFSLIERHRKLTPNPLHWIAQTAPERQPVEENIKQVSKHRAHACFLHGGMADRAFEAGQLHKFKDAVKLIRDEGMLAGLGCHNPRTIIQAEELQFPVDFYFMTLNPVRYHCAEPELSAKVMRESPKPFICFKVLGAGRCRPEVGFKFALASGADFIAVGMFDFQIAENVEIFNRTLREVSSGDTEAFPIYETAFTPPPGSGCKGGFQLRISKPNEAFLVEKLEPVGQQHCPALSTAKALLEDRFLRADEIHELQLPSCENGDCLSVLSSYLKQSAENLQ